MAAGIQHTEHSSSLTLPANRSCDRASRSSPRGDQLETFDSIGQYKMAGSLPLSRSQTPGLPVSPGDDPRTSGLD